MKLIRELARQPDRVAVVVTHDPRVLDYADRIVTLEDGRVAAQKRVENAGRNGESSETEGGADAS
jgi:putative ABC transport system ATP-binding protein